MRLKPKSSLQVRRFLLLVLGISGLYLHAGVASAVADAKVQAILVWGTDETNPTKKSLKHLDGKLHEKLAKVFKWQHYFEVNRQSSVLLAGKTQGLKLSEECSVEIKMLPENVAEVKLIGKGKTLVTRRHSLAKAEALVLAGDDRNNNAWFVVLNFN